MKTEENKYLKDEIEKFLKEREMVLSFNQRAFFNLFVKGIYIDGKINGTKEMKDLIKIK